MGGPGGVARGDLTKEDIREMRAISRQENIKLVECGALIWIGTIALALATMYIITTVSRLF